MRDIFYSICQVSTNRCIYTKLSHILLFLFICIFFWRFLDHFYFIKKLFKKKIVYLVIEATKYDVVFLFYTIVEILNEWLL